MGEPVPLPKEELAKKLVQEIAERGDEIPDRYLHKNGFPEAIEAPPHLWNHTLLIDLALLSSSSPLELAKLRSALSLWGCFLVINHGMEISFLEQVIQVCKQFSQLPLEEKLKCSAADDVFQGYGSDSIYAGNQVVNWNDRLFFSLYPQEKRKLHFWPQKPDNFREIIDEYSKKMVYMIEEIYKAMARCVEIEEDVFLKHQGKKGPITGRVGIYPRCSSPDRVLGVKPHSDGSTVTVLLPEAEVEGLEILNEGEWYKVPFIPGSLFVNLGDLGQVMTNEVFKSTIHRVVANSEKDRVSLAAFCTPEENNKIGPVSELVNDQRPQRYIKFDINEFRHKFFENYAQGRPTIDAFKI